MKQFFQDHTGVQDLYHLSNRSCNMKIVLQDGIIVSLHSKQSNEKHANVWPSIAWSFGSQARRQVTLLKWKESAHTHIHQHKLVSPLQHHWSMMPPKLCANKYPQDKAAYKSLPFMKFSKFLLSRAIFQRHNSKKMCAILQGWGKCVFLALCLGWKETRQLNKEVWGPFYGIVCDRKREGGNCHWCVISFSNLTQRISLHPRMSAFYKACRHISLQKESSPH